MQVFADKEGNTVHVFERECSIQRRNQKVVEESPSPFITPEMRAAMGEVAVQAARAVNYVGAGTIEFLADADRNFYFLEMNTRIQVEHPDDRDGDRASIWCSMQIEVAAGKPLPFKQSDLAQRGWAVECRIYAEDPAAGFVPAPGKIETLRFPEGPGRSQRRGGLCGRGSFDVLRSDDLETRGVGLQIAREAIERMRRALAEFTIAGELTTNLDFHRWIMTHPRFLAGDFDTNFISAGISSGVGAKDEDPDAACRDCSWRRSRRSAARIIATAQRRARAAQQAGRRGAAWRASTRCGAMEEGIGRRCDIVATLDGAEHELEIEETGRDEFRDQARRATDSTPTCVKSDRDSFSILVGKRSFDLDVVREGEDYVVASRGGVDACDAGRCGAATRRARLRQREVSGKGQIKAMMPGRVVSVLVSVGDEVEAQQGLLVVEAMKMENELKAPKAGKVVEVKVWPGQTVEKGELLLVIE